MIICSREILIFKYYNDDRKDTKFNRTKKKAYYDKQ